MFIIREKNKKSFHIILLLVLSGEAIFILPFVLARVFRPTLLSVFDLNHFELGSCFSIYGIVGMISYVLGGSMTDRFQSRLLMSLALLLTAIGGVYMASYPSLQGMQFLFGYWGFTTIFLFWSALIKTTRIWGGDKSQGKAFGILDGGRGLVAAGIGALGVAIFASFVGEDITTMERQDKQTAFHAVILFSSLFVALVGIAVFLWLKMDVTSAPKQKNPITYYLRCLKIPSVYLLMIIIMCAYAGYKITDFFSQFATDVMDYTEIESAQLGTSLLLLRAFGAVIFGYLADKANTSIWLVISFSIIVTGSALIASGLMDAKLNVLFIISVLIAGIGVYGARALYYAAMREGNIPLALTGTAVGLMSLVGYTPDIFVGPIAGYMLDSNPGEKGHQLIFGMLATFSVIGLACSLLFWQLRKRTKSTRF